MLLPQGEGPGNQDDMDGKVQGVLNGYHLFFLLNHLIKKNGYVNAFKKDQNCIDLFKLDSKKDDYDENGGPSNKDNVWKG